MFFGVNRNNVDSLMLLKVDATPTRRGLAQCDGMDNTDRIDRARRSL